MLNCYSLTAGGRTVALLPPEARDVVKRLAETTATDLQQPVEIHFGTVAIAAISPTPLSVALPADAEDQLRELMRRRRLARPDGTAATSFPETLAAQHPLAVGGGMTPAGQGFLICDVPTPYSTTAAWLAYRDTCERLAAMMPLDEHVKARRDAANRALHWRASLSPEQWFWQGAEEEAEGYALVIDRGRASRWVPAPISIPELVELAREVADDFQAPVTIYQRGAVVARVTMRQTHASELHSPPYRPRSSDNGPTS